MIQEKKILFTTVLLFFILPSIYSQNLSGKWNGEFSLQGSSRKWTFELELEQDDSMIKGIGQQVEISSLDQSKIINSTFEVEGNFMGKFLVYEMTKVLQLKSNNGQCLSRCLYEQEETEEALKFTGDCTLTGEFYRDGKYYDEHYSCKNDAVLHVTLEKAKELESRLVEVVDSFVVTKPNVTVQIWDNNKVDGDIVSLYLNGKKVLKDYPIINRTKKLELELGEEANDLVLFAENIGTIPPNTAAIGIWVDDKPIKEIILNSDEGKSEGIRIIVEK